MGKNLHQGCDDRHGSVSVAHCFGSNVTEMMMRIVRKEMGKVTQFFKRGDATLVLDGNEMYTLERAVDTLAMITFDDYMRLKRGEINSLGEKVAMEHIRDNLDVLNALSNALLATKK